MSKIKLKQTVQICNVNVTYSDVLETVNELKSEIQAELEAVGLSDEFEVVVEVKNSMKCVSLGKWED